MIDARQWTVTQLATLDLPVARTLQDFTQNPDGTITASQAVQRGGVEDVYLSMHKNGVRLGTLIARGAGHGAIISSLAPGTVLFDFAGKLVDVDWRHGEITRSSPGVRQWGGVFQSGNVHAVIDRVHGNALFYNQDTKKCYLRSLRDVRNQIDRVLGKAGPLTNIDAQGRMALRNGWAVYGKQLFYLIGQASRSQELIGYDLSTGKLQWRRSVVFRTEAWQEPEGLEVVPHVVLRGGHTTNPPVDIGYTCRIYTGSTFTRLHVIYRLRDPNTWLSTDEGLYVVDPAKVDSSGLEGLAKDGTIRTRRPPGYRLWIERFEDRFGRTNAVTTHGTYYSLDHLLKLKTRSSPAA
jgi:hypothetical protein